MTENTIKVAVALGFMRRDGFRVATKLARRVAKYSGIIWAAYQASGIAADADFDKFFSEWTTSIIMQSTELEPDPQLVADTIKHQTSLTYHAMTS